MRCLGLDVGDRRIGVALSDDTATLASALTTVARAGPRKDVARITAIARENGVETIVVGLPLRMDGTRGEQAEKTLRFAEDLRTRARLPVVTLDERLTTVEAEEILARAGVRGPVRKRLVDQVAAVVILQEYLDHRKAAPAAKTTA